MANLLTANAANVGALDQPVDLLGVGFSHTADFVAYVELGEDEIDGILDGQRLALEAAGFNTRLLLREFEADPRSDDQAAVVTWRITGMPVGVWRLSLMLGQQ